MFVQGRGRVMSACAFVAPHHTNAISLTSHQHQQERYHRRYGCSFSSSELINFLSSTSMSGHQKRYKVSTMMNHNNKENIHSSTKNPFLRFVYASPSKSTAASGSKFNSALGGISSTKATAGSTRAFSVSLNSSKKKNDESESNDNNTASNQDNNDKLAKDSPSPKPKRSRKMEQSKKEKKKKKVKEQISHTSTSLLHPSEFNNGVIPKPKSLSPSAIITFKACPQQYLFQYLYKIKEPPNQVLTKGTMCHSALEKIYGYPPHQRTLKNLSNLYRILWREKRAQEPYDTLFRVEKVPPPPLTQLSFPKSYESDSSTDDEQSDDESLKICIEEEEKDDDDADKMEKEGVTYEWDYAAEKKWGQEALRLLKNYVTLEDPSQIKFPNPIEREMWLSKSLPLDPTKGATGYTSTSPPPLFHKNSHDTFLVRGIVDRIDLIKVPTTPENYNDEDCEPALRVVDYKTGKAPDFKYSQKMNYKIANENFFQLKIYALLYREISKDLDLNLSLSNGTKKVTKAEKLGQKYQIPDMRKLRLMYLTSHLPNEEAAYVDMDLGATQEERDSALQEVHMELSNTWRDILKLVETQDPKAFHHCDRSFCSCHKLRPLFVNGTLWSKENGDELLELNHEDSQTTVDSEQSK